MVNNLDHIYNSDPDTIFREVSTAHEKARDKAADKGDGVHDDAERLTGGEIPKGSFGHMVQLAEFLRVSGFTPLHREVTLVNRSIGYAGTADLIARAADGRIVLIDYKSGKSVWPEAVLQVAALGHCEFILHPDGTEDYFSNADEMGVLHLRPRSWWYYRIDKPDVMSLAIDAFLAAKEIADWRRMHDSLIFGQRPKMNAANWSMAA